MPGDLVRDLAEHSYGLVRAGLTRAAREALLPAEALRKRGNAPPD